MQIRRDFLRGISGLLVLWLLIGTLAACSLQKTPEASDPEAELRENRFVRQQAVGVSAAYHDGILYFVEPCYENVDVKEYEDGIYAATADVRCNLLYYADLKTGESGVLCGRPECAHADASCSAYIQESLETKLMVYHNRLYRIEYTKHPGSKARLLSSALDGSDLVEEKVLDARFASASSGQTFLYQDRIYVCGGFSAVSNGVPRSSLAVYSEPLKGSGEPQIILEKTPDDLGWTIAARIREGNLYFVVSCQRPRDEDGNEGSIQPSRIYVCHLSDGSLEQLYCGDTDIPDQIESLTVQENCLILQGQGILLRYSLADGSFSPVLTSDTEHATFLADGLIGATGESRNWSFYRENGDVVYSDQPEPEGIEEKLGFFDEIGVCDGIVCRFVNGRAFRRYLETFDPESLKFRVLWENECLEK